MILHIQSKIMKEYKSARSAGVNNGAEVSGEHKGIGLKLGASASEGFKDKVEFFMSGKGVMMISTAECILHVLKINTFLMPGRVQFICLLFLLQCNPQS